MVRAKAKAKCDGVNTCEACERRKKAENIDSETDLVRAETRRELSKSLYSALKNANTPAQVKEVFSEIILKTFKLTLLEKISDTEKYIFDTIDRSLIEIVAVTLGMRYSFGKWEVDPYNKDTFL